MYAIPSASAVSDEQVEDLRVDRRAARDRRAAAEAVLALDLRVAAGHVGRVRHVDRDRDRRLERERRDARAAEVADLLLHRRDRRDVARAPPASATRRAASSATYAPSRLSSEREATRPFGSSTGSPAITTTSPGRTSRFAPRRRPSRRCRCAGPSSIVSCGSAALGATVCLARSTTPGSSPSFARHDHDRCAAQHLGDPTADGAEEDVAALVDVRDDQPDLVDVPDDREQRPASPVPAHARDRGAERVARHLRERRRRLAPHRVGAVS